MTIIASDPDPDHDPDPDTDDPDLPRARPVYARAELTARGMTRHDITTALEAGSVTRVGRDAYVVGGRASRERDDLVERGVAVSRRLGEGGVLSHVSAAALHGLPLWGLPTGRVTASLPQAGRGHRRTPSLVVYDAPLDGAVTVVDGIPVTTPARTAVDLARAHRLDPAVCVADRVLARGLAGTEELRRHVDAAAGFRGVSRARRMLDLATGEAVNPLETRSRLAVLRGGLPPAEVNVDLYDESGGFLARPDFLWRAWRLVGECDGLEKYTLGGTDKASVKAAIAEEKAREERLRAAGWVIIRWMWRDLDDPRALVRRIRAAMLRQEAAGFGPGAGRLSA